MSLQKLRAAVPAGRRTLALGALATLLTLPASAQDPGRDLWVEAGTAERIELTLDGQPATATGSLAPGAWQTFVYLEGELLSSTAVRSLAETLLETLGPLLELGPVVVVRSTAGELTPSIPSQDREIVERALYEAYFRSGARNELRKSRTRWLDATDRSPAAAAAEAVAETELLRQRQDALLTWMAGLSAPGPKLLVLLAEPLGLDPADFYDAGGPAPVGEILELASAGEWVVAPARLPATEDSGRISYAPSEELPVGFRVTLGRDDALEPTAATDRVASDAEVGLDALSSRPWNILAAGTAGRLIESSRDVERLARELSRRRPYRVDLGAWPAGESVELAVVSPSVPAAPRRISAGSPRVLAEVRARALLGDLDFEGEVPVHAIIRTEPTGAAELDTRAEWPPPADGQSVGPLRATTVLQGQDGRLTFHHRLLDQLVPGQGGELAHTEALALPADTRAAGVILEDLRSGAWGGSLASFVRTRGGGGEGIEPGDLEPRIRIRTPEEVPTRGRFEIATETADEVARVVFFLNGEAVAERNREPFAAPIRLRGQPGQHLVEAVAYDADGRELDRDLLVLNESTSAFRARITSPTSGDHIGPIAVTAEVAVPEDAELRRVDFYWRDRLVATSRQAPHRQRVVIPYSDPAGFIRVVAELEDGRRTEDVVLMNSARFGTEVQVEVVELYVVVTDRDGQPVRGLEEADFTVRDSGVEQEVRNFRAAGDLPLTVGLAIDSSSSLFVKLPRVQEAARDFVDNLHEDRDRAFLVGFGSAPRVLQAATRNLDRVSRSISRLAPEGRTAVWEAVVLSLLQLEDVPGRKALVVFYDGDDEDEDFSYRTARTLARESGVPIYLIVMNNTAARTNGQGFRTRSFTGKLERLAAAGGGQVYYVRTDADLSTTFAAIAEELRSHYLITYYPEGTGGSTWRAVEVDVEGRGLTARTLSGYGSDGL